MAMRTTVTTLNYRVVPRATALPLTTGIVALMLAGGCPGDVGDDGGADSPYVQIISEYCREMAACEHEGSGEEACVDITRRLLDGYVAKYGCVNEWTAKERCVLENSVCEDEEEYRLADGDACRDQDAKVRECMLNNGAPDNADSCDQVRQQAQTLECDLDAHNFHRFHSYDVDDCRDAYDMSFCDLTDFWDCYMEAYTCEYSFEERLGKFAVCEEYGVCLP